MTTKKFRLIEFSTDGSIFDENVYNTRKEATHAIANIMEHDEHADPQLFKIQVEEVDAVNEDEVVMEAANKVAKSLSIYGDKFNIVPFTNGFVEMHSADQKYPSLSRYEMECVYKVMDEVSAELPEGFSVFANITHECAIRIILSIPKNEENK